MRLRDGLEVLPMPPRRIAQDEAWAAMAPAFSAVSRRQLLAGGGDWESGRRAPLWNRGRRMFQAGEALRPTPLRLADGPDRSGRLHSLPLRAADDPPGRASADWAFILGEKARLHLLRVPAGVLPITGGRLGRDADAAPKPEQHVVLLTDGGVCARDWRDDPVPSSGQPPGVWLSTDRCNGVFWWPVRAETPRNGIVALVVRGHGYWRLRSGQLSAPPDGFALARLHGPAFRDLNFAQPNEHLRYADFVEVVGREALELGVAQRDFAPAGWHFPTRAEAEDFAVLLLSAMPSLEVQPPGQSALPSRGFVVVTRPAELPAGAEAPAAAPQAGPAR